MNEIVKIHALELPTLFGPARDGVVGELTPLALEQRLSLEATGKLNGVHPTTFERAYPHLVEKIGPRRKTVKLKYALNPNAYPPPE